MKNKRSSGLLMHITSLPGKYGIGTMGKEAYDFVDRLREGGQKYWQMLPVGPVTGNFAYSPYSSYSSFAGNYLFIDMEALQKEEWMRTYFLSDIPENEYNDFVDFNEVIAYKVPVLKNAADNFFKYADDEVLGKYNDFCNRESHWLKDFALFAALSHHFETYYWLNWEPDIRLRKPEAVKKWSEELKDDIAYHSFVQFIFFKQWEALKRYALESGVKIIGDIPIYVTFDSVETWAWPELFQLDEKTMKPTHVAGVPPDYFSKTGQLWGNPLYRWFRDEKLSKEIVDWWAARFKHMLHLFDVVRVDHFRGFEAYWAVPAGEKTAVNGTWKKGPGAPFFKKIMEKLETKKGALPLIAEDLGIITPKVEKLRDDLGLPGMKVLQFAFSGGNKNEYLPCNYKTSNCVVYTGTHDNNTTNGWFYEHELDEDSRQFIMKYLDLDHLHEFHWQLINLALGSTANLAIVPVQDILGYAGRFRMNTPGVSEGNWKWKLTPGRLTSEILQKLKSRCVTYNRGNG